MKIDQKEIERRKPLWVALSDLFLDTELDELDFIIIAEEMKKSGYPPEELHRILMEEVFPVCILNLHHPAGVWEGFDEDWLVERILESKKPVEFKRFLHKRNFGMIKKEWENVMFQFKRIMNLYKVDFEHWQKLWTRLGCNTDVSGLYSKLIDAYSQKHRAYHNVNHLEQCLTEFDEIRKLLTSPDEVEMAIWFHDAIYDPTSHSNEADSAAWAVKELQNHGIDEERTSKINAFILATKHDGIPGDSDTQFLLDIDLSILGSEYERYQEYEKSIHEEYKWVSEDVFRKKRAEILQTFLDREWIYYTEIFKEKYESRARVNLANAISVLEKHTISSAV